MTYTVMSAKSDSDYVYAADWQDIRANWIAGIPDIFEAKGDIAAATDTDAATRVYADADWHILTADAAEAAGMKFNPMGVYLAIDPGTTPDTSNDFSQFAECTTVISDKAAETIGYFQAETAGVYLIQATLPNVVYNPGYIYYKLNDSSMDTGESLIVKDNIFSYGKDEVSISSGGRLLSLSANDIVYFNAYTNTYSYDTTFLYASMIGVIQIIGGVS